MLAPLEGAPWLALDFETQGLEVTSTQQIVGAGLSDGKFATYIPLLDSPSEVVKSLLNWLCGRPLAAHNIPFDGAWFKREAGQHPTWIMDTQGVFKQLATEGFFRQTWSLKTAMVDILGWDAPNTEDLYRWLKDNGLKVGDMWRAPNEILGKYCALDALATAHLKIYFDTFRSQFPDFFGYHEKDFLTVVRLCTDQYLRGMKLDLDALYRYKKQLTAKLEAAKSAFLNHTKVSEHVQQFNRARYEKWVAAEPSPKVTKAGETTFRWRMWKSRERWAATNMHFKITSKDHLRWLFFECLYTPEIVQEPLANPARNFREFGRFRVNIDGKYTVPLFMTKAGQFSTDKKVLPHLGELGQLLIQYNQLATKLRFVDSCLKVQQDQVLHPRFKIPGTVTGRLSGGIES